MNAENTLEEIQLQLKVKFSLIYREFLSTQGLAIIDGFSVMGISTKEDTPIDGGVFGKRCFF